MDETFKGILKEVAEAQNCDAKGDYKAAYLKYLQGTHSVTQSLLNNVLKTQEVCCDVTTRKMVSLAAMCIQRTDDILNNKMNYLPSKPATVMSRRSLPCDPGYNIISSTVTSPTSGYGVDGTIMPTLSGSANDTASIYLPGNRSSMMSPSPLELAEKQNMQIIAAYRARMSGLNQHKATSMSLSLQRRLAENLAIGKAREQSLAKKRAERRIRLEAETAKRFTATLGMSEDELERRHIYTRILEFEQDNKWLLPWRQKLKEKFEDCELIQQLVNLILRSPSHPLTQLLYSYQHRSYNQIQPILNQWHDVHKVSLENQMSTQFRNCDDSSQDSEPKKAQNQPAVSTISASGESKLFPSATYDVSNFDDLFDKGSEEDDEIEAGLLEHDASDNENSTICAAESSNNHKSEYLVNPPLNLSETEQSDAKLVKPSDAQNTTDQALDTVNKAQGTSEAHNTVNKAQGTSETHNTVNKAQGTSETQHTVNKAQDTSKTQNTVDKTSTNLSLMLEEQDREAVLRHLTTMTRDTQDNLERLVTMFIVAYDSLDHATGRDCCYSSLEEPFYKPLWQPILTLFRLVYKMEECQASDIMLHHKDSSPEDLAIPRKFCLLPEDSLLMPEGYQPYESAITELQSLANMVSPLNKLECIVQVSRIICRCVEEFYANNKDEIPNIGADDLLPLLSYVVIKSNMPQVLAECHALEELIHEGYLMGEEGYCLTSLQTAVKYLISLEH